MSKTRIASALVVVAASALPAGASTLSWVDGIGVANATAVTAGSSFTVTVRLNATEGFIGTSVYAFDPGYTNAARFTLESRTRVSNVFADGDATTVNVAGDIFDGKTQDYGYVRNDAAVQASGTYDLMTLTIDTSSTLATGIYTLQLTGGVTGSNLTTGNFDDVQFTNLSPADPLTAVYNVAVTAAPEPAELTLMGLTSVGALARRRSHAR